MGEESVRQVTNDRQRRQMERREQLMSGGMGRFPIAESFNQGGLKGAFTSAVEGFRDDLTPVADQINEFAAAAEAVRPEKGKILRRIWEGPPSAVDPDAVEAEVNDRLTESEKIINLHMGRSEATFNNLSALSGEAMSATGQQALNALFDEAQLELDDIDAAIVEANQGMALYGLMRNPEKLATMGQAQSAGVAPSGSATADAVARLVAQTGVTPEQAAASGLDEGELAAMAAHGEELINAGAVGADVDRDLEGLSAEAASIYADADLATGVAELEFKGAMHASLRDLTEQRRAVTENYDSIQAALQAEDLAQTSGKFTLNVDASPQGAYDEGFAEIVGTFMDTQGARNEIEEEELAAKLSALDGQVGVLLADTEDVKKQAVAKELVLKFANDNGLDYEQTITALTEGRAVGMATMAEAEKVWETTRFTPGSRGLATAIYGVAEQRYSPEQANMLANSPALHMIVQLGSRGRVGHQGAGTLSGLGGLSAAEYSRLDADAGSGDARVELDALLKMIESRFGGDPVAALQHFAEHSSWGGE